jgi:hypothetical protein
VDEEITLRVTAPELDAILSLLQASVQPTLQLMNKLVTQANTPTIEEEDNES